MTCDVTDSGSLAKLRDATIAAFGSVEILVNCAGIAVAKRITLAGNGPNASIIDGSGNLGGRFGEQSRIMTVVDSLVSIDQLAFQGGADANDENFENCSASIDDVQAAAERLGLTQHVKLVKGWFNQTLAIKRQEVGQIAILRIDNPRPIGAAE